MIVCIKCLIFLYKIWLLCIEMEKNLNTKYDFYKWPASNAQQLLKNAPERKLHFLRNDCIFVYEIFCNSRYRPNCLFDVKIYFNKCLKCSPSAFTQTLSRFRKSTTDLQIVSSSKLSQITFSASFR